MHRFLAVILLVALICPLHAGENGVLKARFDDKGLAGLSYAGVEFAVPGAPEVLGVMLEKVGKDEKGFRTHAFEKPAAAPTQARFDQAALTYTGTFAWGEAVITYTPAPDRLGISVTLTNKSDRVLADFEIRLAQLKFPSKPEGLDRHGIRSGLDNLMVVKAVLPQAQVLACMETIDPPTRFGCAGLKGKQKTESALMLLGGVRVEEPGGYWINPLGRPRIDPGKSLTVKCSLRFAPAGKDTQALVDDIYKAFAAHYTWMNDWPDRRPIGMLMRSSGYKGHKSEKNPRGWFWNPKLDITTPEGKANFKEAAMKDAERCVSVLKGIDGQGMVLSKTRPYATLERRPTGEWVVVKEPKPKK